MTRETFEKYKQDLASGKIAVLDGGRTAASLEELMDIYEAQGGVPFGQTEQVEVMAIDSGRMSPMQIAELGPDNPLIVAAHHLTEAQIDDLAAYITLPLQHNVDQAQTAIANLREQVNDLTEKLTAAEAKANAPSTTPPVEQAVQAQMATGANDAVTPKTALDNKTNATVPAGKNASKADGDAAQTAEAETAKAS